MKLKLTLLQVRQLKLEGSTGLSTCKECRIRDSGKGLGMASSQKKKTGKTKTFLGE